MEPLQGHCRKKLDVEMCAKGFVHHALGFTIYTHGLSPLLIDQLEAPWIQATQNSY